MNAGIRRVNEGKITFLELLRGFVGVSDLCVATLLGALGRKCFQRIFGSGENLAFPRFGEITLGGPRGLKRLGRVAWSSRTPAGSLNQRSKGDTPGGIPLGQACQLRIDFLALSQRQRGKILPHRFEICDRKTGVTEGNPIEAMIQP